MLFNVDPAVENYFRQEYEKIRDWDSAIFWPELKSKAEIDEWINSLKPPEDRLNLLYD